MAPIWVDACGANRILVAPGANDAVDGRAVTRGFVDRDGVAVVLAQLETPQSASAEAFRLAHQRGAVTILNPAPAATIDAPLLALTDWLIPNESEYELLFGRPPDVADITNEAPDRPYGLIVTMGAAGAIVSDRVVDVGGERALRLAMSSTQPAPATPSSVRSPPDSPQDLIRWTPPASVASPGRSPCAPLAPNDRSRHVATWRTSSAFIKERKEHD